LRKGSPRIDKHGGNQAAGWKEKESLMSQHSGPFSVVNDTGQTITGSVSHSAEGCPDQTPCTFTSLPNGQSASGGQWQTETSSTDRWAWNTNAGGGTKDCGIESSDSSVAITLTASGIVIAPSSSSSCSGDND
jgi:hypothetical protein